MEMQNDTTQEIKKTGTRLFSHWGLGLGILSLILYKSFFLMFFGAILSAIGLIFGLINLVTGIRYGNKNDITIACIGLLLNLYVLVFGLLDYSHLG